MKFNISRKTNLFFYNLIPSSIQNTLDYDYLIKRDPSIKAIIQPGSDSTFHKCFFGENEILIPIYPSLDLATVNHPDVEVLVNFSSARSAFSSTMEAISTNQFKLISIIAEGIPENQARELIHTAKQKQISILGPSTVGLISAGNLRVGNIGGSIENIIDSKLFQSGSVGLITRSGGLCNELCNIISKNSNGVSSAFAIGGDRFIGLDFYDLALNLQNDPQTKVILILGEVGGTLEHKLVEAVKQKLITKPVIAYCIGTSASVLGDNIQFGHAGAQANSEFEAADFKNNLMKQTGIHVPTNFADLSNLLSQVSTKLNIQDQDLAFDVSLPPAEYNQLKQDKKVRKSSNFICSISDDRGSEFTINKTPLVNLVSDTDTSLVDIITLLWFKQKYPRWASNFLDIILKLLSDHGPAVSGAHNAKVTARAGKDLITSLVSGLLTIGPKFGGAIDSAALYFHQATTSKKSPFDFVADMKKMQQNIPGIGHKIKSIHNPDTRVKLLCEYASKHFPNTHTLDFALQVEKITTGKKATLILNVDGAIAALMIDLWRGIGYSDTQISELINSGVLNAFFALSRSIGFIGHILDEKRFQQSLYRHDTDDILYL